MRSRADDMRSRAADYVAGALEGGSRARFEEALSGDEELRALVEGLAALWEGLPDRAAAVSPVGLRPLVESRLRMTSRIVAFPTAVPRWRMAVSFAAVVFVGIAAWALATGGPADTSAAEQELLAHESIFETLDPIPSSSVGGLWFTALPLEPEGEGGPR